MNIASYFQKNAHKKHIAVLKRMYLKTCRSNTKRIKYLRDAGAKIGEGCHIGSVGMFGSEPYLIEVGDNVYFASGVQMLSHDGGTMQLYHMGLTDRMYDNLGKIKIGNNCFIGFGCIILKNVTIGDNCIIGAGSVVSKSIPGGSVAAGVPAKVICTVQEYYDKNKAMYDDTINMRHYDKRKFIENNLYKYENRRISREI